MANPASSKTTRLPSESSPSTVALARPSFIITLWCPGWTIVLSVPPNDESTSLPSTNTRMAAVEPGTTISTGTEPSAAAFTLCLPGLKPNSRPPAPVSTTSMR